MIDGLSEKEAKARLKKYGKNQLKETKRIDPYKIFISQFTSPLIILLIFAAIVSYLVGLLSSQESNFIDTLLILVIVFIAGISGFFQEYKAEKSIEALKKVAMPKARVIRDGKKREILATELVPGDVIMLESGDIVPADAKIIDSYNLKVDESILTGESEEAEKKNDDEIFMNTAVTVGNAIALVTRTGMRTEIGKIASRLQEIKEEKTQFQSEMEVFGRKIFWFVIFITIMICFFSLFKYGLYKSMLTAISLAVAAVPEGLPAVVVLTLAIGARAMVNKNALTRRLSAIESLGTVDVICTDKTGTITKGEMNVVKLFFNNNVIDIERAKRKEIKPILICGALCNNSKIGYDKKKKIYMGDHTEIAIRKMSERFGVVKEKLEKEYHKIGEIPFTSKRKIMSVIYRHKKQKIIYSKGAPEILIEKCNKIYHNKKAKRLTKSLKKAILKQNENFASQGLRVMGFAFKPNSNKEKNLIWLGLEALLDSPRKEVKQALRDCASAGIRVIMITGDNPLTAKAVASEIGLNSNGVLEAKDLDKMTDKQLSDKLDSGLNIFARVSPIHKLRVLKILKRKNRVAMTGDGVNDCLALKKADIGIAMGIRGAEVAKETSDIILLDDNFATIRDAIREGRRIFDNIHKFVSYLFVCNFGEIGVLLLATMFIALREPILLPVQILWINLLTDGFPALALGIDPARPDIMIRPPRKKGETIMNKSMWLTIFALGTELIAMLFFVFFLTLPLGIEKARTALFTGFVLFEFLRIGIIRYQERISYFANKWLLLALAISLLLQLIIVYSPMNIYFHIVPLGIYEWLVLLAIGIIGSILAILLARLIMRYSNRI
ncbi:MAG: cation-translocating P-type ATPase [Candidatus Aenigmatarchaeota archaeon]